MKIKRVSRIFLLFEGLYIFRMSFNFYLINLIRRVQLTLFLRDLKLRNFNTKVSIDWLSYLSSHIWWFLENNVSSFLFNINSNKTRDTFNSLHIIIDLLWSGGHTFSKPRLRVTAKLISTLWFWTTNLQSFSNTVVFSSLLCLIPAPFVHLLLIQSKLPSQKFLFILSPISSRAVKSYLEGFNLVSIFANTLWKEIWRILRSIVALG